jgi:hypothetical protein
MKISCQRGRTAGLLLLLVVGGCQSEMPFEVVPIQGKVTYEDGSLIETGSITITFNPADAPAIGKMTPPGGQASVNVADGTFFDVMTRRPGDGVLVGRHKVVVISYNPRADGRPEVSKAIPARYHKLATTPLEIEVKPETGQFFEIKVSKN